MMDRLLDLWRRLRQWTRKNRNERETASARARFWAEVQEGRREAEARTRS